MKHTLSFCLLCIAICAYQCADAQSAYYSVLPARNSLMPAQPAAFDTFVNTAGITVTKIMDSLHSLISPADTAEGGAMDEWKTFNKFWTGRAGVNDSSGHNMFRQYYAALRSALAGAGACGSSGYQGAWQCIGPDNLPTQTMGRVDVVWADPGDSNFILAGGDR